MGRPVYLSWRTLPWLMFARVPTIVNSSSINRGAVRCNGLEERLIYWTFVTETPVAPDCRDSVLCPAFGAFEK